MKLTVILKGIDACFGLLIENRKRALRWMRRGVRWKDEARDRTDILC